MFTFQTQRTNDRLSREKCTQNISSGEFVTVEITQSSMFSCAISRTRLWNKKKGKKSEQPFHRVAWNTPERFLGRIVMPKACVVRRRGIFSRARLLRFRNKIFPCLRGSTTFPLHWRISGGRGKKIRHFAAPLCGNVDGEGTMVNWMLWNGKLLLRKRIAMYDSSLLGIVDVEGGKCFHRALIVFYQFIFGIIHVGCFWSFLPIIFKNQPYQLFLSIICTIYF